MFALPDTQALRLYIGATRQGTGSVLFEVTHEAPGQMIRLRSLPNGHQEHTLRVIPGRPGSAQAYVEVTETVPPMRKSGYETERRNHLRRWLSAVRAVIEGRAAAPGAEMAGPLRQACMTRPRINDACSASASATINADPASVWEAVHSPDSARFVGSRPAICSGYVPGTPQGEQGEMQYFIHEGENGRHSGSIAVVTETTRQRSAVTHVLGGILEQQYLLTPESESGPTRLDLTCRWPAPKQADSMKAAESQMTEELRKMAGDYKSLIEAAGLRA
jgi:hypothetical protein